MVLWRHSHQSKHLQICTDAIAVVLYHWCMYSTDLLSVLETKNFAMVRSLIFLMLRLKFYFYPTTCLELSSWCCVVVSPSCLNTSCILFCCVGTWWCASLWCSSLFLANGMVLWLGIWLQHPFVNFLTDLLLLTSSGTMLILMFCCICDLLEAKNKELPLALTKESVPSFFSFSHLLCCSALTWNPRILLSHFFYQFTFLYFDLRTSHPFVLLSSLTLNPCYQVQR